MIFADDKLSYAVIGKAMEVHRELGPGVDECFYHELLVEKLCAAGIEHQSKPRGQLMHRGRVADVFEPDIVIGSRLVLELKWLWSDFAPEHFVQAKCYLKFWRITDALLFDFGKESLVHRRYVFTDQPAPPLSLDEMAAAAPATISNRQLVAQLCQAIGQINDTHGLGYRDTTYRGLLGAELQHADIPCAGQPTAHVRAGGRILGQTQLRCLSVAGEGAVMVLALRDEIRAADRAILQSGLHHLGLRWGVVVNFGKKETQVRWVTTQ